MVTFGDTATMEWHHFPAAMDSSMPICSAMVSCSRHCSINDREWDPGYDVVLRVRNASVIPCGVWLYGTSFSLAFRSFAVMRWGNSGLMVGCAGEGMVAS